MITYNDQFEVAGKALNIPFTTGLGYYSGTQIGLGLGLDSDGQRNLGRISGLNAGLSSTATFIQSLRRRREARDRFNYARANDYERLPYDQYAYDPYSNTRYDGNYFQDGGETTYSGGTLPEFTVVANRKGSERSNDIRLLEELQGVEDRPLYHIWENAGKPKIRTKDRDYAGGHLKDGSIEIPTPGMFEKSMMDSYLRKRARKNNHRHIRNPELSIFLNEIPHAIQEKEMGIKELNRLSHREWDRYGEDAYTTPGTVEYNAHNIIQPRVFNSYDEGNPFNTKVQYFQDGGIPTSSKGLYDYPNQVVDVPSNDITMEGINYPVLAIPDNDPPRIMRPGGRYKYPNSKKVREVPMYQDGGVVFDATSGGDEVIFDATTESPNLAPVVERTPFMVNPFSSVVNKDAPKGGTIAVSHNNPGNIKMGNYAQGYGATPGRSATDGGVFAVFPDVSTGLRAQRDLLKGKNYINLTVDDAMKRWSNSGYGGEIYPAISNKTMLDLTDGELEELQRRQIKREDVDMYKLIYNAQ